MEIINAIYIKLGKKGLWAKNSIDNGIIRIGWGNVPIPLIKENKWDEKQPIIRDEYIQRNGSKHGYKQDFNALKKIYEADERTVFITFYSGKMYWCISKQKLLGVLRT